MPPITQPLPMIREGQLILLIGLIQFVNILDFMMVMPMGPDFAKALAIPVSDIGLIGGSYTFAAAIAGLGAALFIDQFPRKKAVIFCLIGLSFATLAGAFVWNRESMIGARLLAGLFGGPLTSLAQAVIADYIPPERRGRAMGKVAGAFAAASVLGVPFGLELAQRISWHAPFITTAILGGLVTVLAIYKLPYRDALSHATTMAVRIKHLRAMLSSPLALMSYLFMFMTMMAGFMIIPNIAAHLQLNWGYPREHLGLLYLCGGAASFFCMRGAGWLVDRYSATLAAVLFTVILLFCVSFGFVWYPSAVPVVVIFMLFMVAMSGRMVAAQTLSSKVPQPYERGAYMSLQSSVTHMGSALGAYYSSLVLREVDGKLLHMNVVGATTIGLSLIVPLLFWAVERRVRGRAK